MFISGGTTLLTATGWPSHIRLFRFGRKSRAKIGLGTLSRNLRVEICTKTMYCIAYSVDSNLVPSHLVEALETVLHESNGTQDRILISLKVKFADLEEQYFPYEKKKWSSEALTYVYRV